MGVILNVVINTADLQTVDQQRMELVGSIHNVLSNNVISCHLGKLNSSQLVMITCNNYKCHEKVIPHSSSRKPLANLRQRGSPYTGQ